jgi:polyhydroxybutyrate depolymerase
MGNAPAVSIFLVLLAASALDAARHWRAQIDSDEKLSLRIGGQERTYLLHVPESLPAGKKTPLVLAFHGGGSHAANTPHFTRFDALADPEDFLVAYPDSFNTHWNDRRGLSPADDVGFVRTLIAEVERSHSVDSHRIYATGISNGGFFSNRLACELSTRLAAIASVAATMPESLIAVCKPTAPISVMFIQGTKDPLVHIEGGIVGRDHGRSVSLADAVKFWRDFDGISAPPISTELTDNVGDGTHVRREVYGGGKLGTEVIVYTIEGGGHTWPGGPQYLPVFLVGKASRNLDATRVMWEFFKKHSRE